MHFYRYLYDTIGDAYKWVDRRKKSDAELAEIVQHPKNELYVLYAEGCPAGMAELDMRDDGIGQLAYFGLMPDYVGRHFGYYFLYHACMNRLGAADPEDAGQHLHAGPHPRALPLYQRIGFSPTAAKMPLYRDAVTSVGPICLQHFASPAGQGTLRRCQGK